ncbi:MAG: TonB-dependent receptor [Gemmatimonadota bacterium]|jgi:hypothetical protein
MSEASGIRCWNSPTGGVRARGRRSHVALVLFLVFSLMSVSSLFPDHGLSQEEDPNRLLVRPARLAVGDTLLSDALRALHRSSGVSIAFSPDLLPQGLRVSCPCGDFTVGEALAHLLRETGLTFEATRTLVRVVPPPPPTPAVPRNAGTLAGRILAAETGAPVVNVMIRLEDGRGALSDEEGRFILTGIPPGEYELSVGGMGWEPVTMDGIQIRVDETTIVDVSMLPVVIPLAEMVVAPSTYGILTDPLVTRTTLSREEVRALPQLGEDLFRTMERLPGISTNDFTARLYVRGSRADEVLTLFDGIELFEPYHLKQWDAVLSILDVESVGNVSLITGGFPAEYGDRSAAVFSLASVEPPTDETKTALGLSFMNASLRSQGPFAQGKGGWFLTARRGFLDIVFKLAHVQGDFHPAYYDLFGKVQYEPRPGHRLSARVLHAADDLQGADEDDFSSHADLYGSSYLWITSENQLTESLSSRSILSGSRIYKNRHAEDFRELGADKIMDVRDRLETWYLGFKTDLSWDLSQRVVLKGGLDLRAGWADYDYFRWRRDGTPNFTDPAGPAFYIWTDTLDMAVEPSGLETGAYLAGRFRGPEALTTELGLRAHHNSVTGRGEISPRLSAAYRLLPGTTLRGAWGSYPQAPGLHELQVADADSIFHSTQTAEHRILGVEQLLGDAVTLRIEAFQRRTDDPFPEYRNLVEDVEAVWEEGPGDRIMVWPDQRRAEGLEFFAKGRLGNRIAWSASYSLARAEDRVDGKWMPRPYDQRHTTHLHLAFHPSPSWTLTAVWQARSGWPASEQTFEIVELATGDPVTKNEFTNLYGVRLPPYRRLDLRASKRFELPKGRLFLDLDLFNALNRENPQNLDYRGLFFDPYRRMVQFDAEVEPQIPLLVTLGLRWEF